MSHARSLQRILIAFAMGLTPEEAVRMGIKYS